MAAACTFGISFSIRAGHDEFTQDPDQAPIVTTPCVHPLQFEDGLCPYSDEKEVVVDTDNYVDRSVWRTTTTTEDLVQHEDSTSILNSDAKPLDGPQVAFDISQQDRPNRLDCTRAWHFTKTVVKNASSSSKHLNSACDPSNDIDGVFISPTITRAEFERLPLTIQRKHFSTLERLRLAKDLGNSWLQDSAVVLVPAEAVSEQTVRATTAPSVPNKVQQAHHWPCHRNPAGSKSCDFESRNDPRLSSLDQELLTRLPEKVKRRHLSREEQLIARHQQFIAQNRNSSELSDDVERERSKSRTKVHHLDLAEILESGSISSGFMTADMASDGSSTAPSSAALEEFQDKYGFYETLRWLDEDESLDLRLGVEDHTEEVTSMPKTHYDGRPSVRRQLSLSSRLPFSRPSLSHQSRAMTNDAIVVHRPTLANHHVRSHSKALSLLSPHKHTRQDSSTTNDAAALHYQDPGARMRLRHHLASPQKFDEAIEFGFPSVDERQGDSGADQRRHPGQSTDVRTWLNDESSTCSDRSSLSDPESPKTPPIIDRPSFAQPYRVGNHAVVTTADHMQEPMREMTLRMTLTRPDLRAGDSDIYGWQQNVHAGRAQHIRGESSSQGTSFGQTGPKSSIERQLMAIDQDLANTEDNRALKRFWNRVRRT